jgi:hypothetical protein
VSLLAIDPAEFTPGELAYRIRTQVAEGARLVVLDSVNGYLNAMPEERFLSAHLHELLDFLSEPSRLRSMASWERRMRRCSSPTWRTRRSCSDIPRLPAR